MTETKSSRSLLMPLMFGMVGAGLALLFAPRSGRETRDQMRRKADDIKERAEESLANVRKTLDDNIEEAQDLKRRLAQAMGNTGKKARQDIEDLREDTARQTPAQSVLSTWEEEV